MACFDAVNVCDTSRVPTPLDLPPFFRYSRAMAGYMDDDWLPPSEDEEEELSIADIGMLE